MKENTRGNPCRSGRAGKRLKASSTNQQLSTTGGNEPTDGGCDGVQSGASQGKKRRDNWEKKNEPVGEKKTKKKKTGVSLKRHTTLE